MQPTRLDNRLGMQKSKLTKISDDSSCYICFPTPRCFPTDIGRPRSGIVKINLDFGFGEKHIISRRRLSVTRLWCVQELADRAMGDGCSSDKILGLVQSDVSGSER